MQRFLLSSPGFTRPPSSLAHRPSLACAAVAKSGGFGASSSGASTGPKIPKSKEDAIQQAISCILGQVLRKRSGPKSKSLSGPTSLRKLLVELPLMETSPEAMADVAAAFARGLNAADADLGSLTFVFFEKEAARAAAAAPRAADFAGCTVTTAESARGKPLLGPIVLVGARASQLGEVEEVLSDWRGLLCLGINSEIDAEAAPSRYRALAASFEIVYSFLPLEIKGVFSNKSGAVFKYAPGPGPAAEEPWRIYSTEPSGALRLIAQQSSRRPTSDDLEISFLNKSASDSPLTKVAKGFRGIVDGAKGKGKGKEQ